MRPEPNDFTLPLARILEDRSLTVRIVFGDIDELAVRLMTEGQREPVMVREEAGEYYVVDGHRRHRALVRALQLRIVPEEGRHLVYEGNRPLREAPRPVNASFDPRKVRCRLVECGAEPGQIFAAQWVHNRGRPFGRLERTLLLSRLLKQGGPAAEALARRIGFTPEQIAEAWRLHPADFRLLDQVRQGLLSSELALGLLRTAPAGEQIERLKAARAAAQARGSERLEARDFGWEDAAEADREDEGAQFPPDPFHTRFADLVARLGDATQAAPNPAAEDRLGTLLLVYRYALGQIGYDRLETHLLGRQ